ncbi:uncharacterized protein PAC_01666 [Phialocephala subalpina]|uniref:F-box domain-containing protein n=1 Tax=Phialocephala subalpina TaxID=576137 RepID=A0A1L7WG96_9HELO|nr:uncharacterized protein PAC_01666 [Phialocephala subalpina]
MANTLIALPNEILHNIFKYVDPRDLAQVFLTCKVMRKFSDDAVLFREVYCEVLDEPAKDFTPANLNYKQELIKFCQVRDILQSDKPVEEKLSKLPLVSTFLTQACYTSSPTSSRNIRHMKSWFDDKSRQPILRDNIESFLCQSSTFFRARHQDNTLARIPFSDRQASAKLHCYYGVPIFPPRTRRWDNTYPYAVSMVYDLRNYTEESKWGPYRQDGMCTVDWEKMEAVMIVLGHNMHTYSRQSHMRGPKIWKDSFGGIAPNSFFDKGKIEGRDGDKKGKGKGKRREGEDDIRRSLLLPGMEDPYNITGTWTRIVCFLDFHDLFAYNFTTGQPEDGQPRPPLSTTEAIRLITMELHTTKIEAPGPDDGQDLPIVHFEGISRSSMNTSWDPNASSTITGTVRLTKEGEVRWKTVSVYAGEERWASEGIQVGGIRSARGVLGHWFDKDHDIHGPAGPTAFWKSSDEFESENEYHDDHSELMYHEVYIDEDEVEEEIEGEEGEGENEENEEYGVSGGLVGSDLANEDNEAAYQEIMVVILQHMAQHAANGSGGQSSSE